MVYRFKCTTCDAWHEGLPDLGYDEPAIAADIPSQDKPARVIITSDLCEIDNEFFFVRCNLRLPIKESDESFSFGIWSSLSKTNFKRYQAHFDEDMRDWDPMFGWFSNQLPNYPATLGLKLSVQTGAKGMRPLARLEPTDHPLSTEQREGITLEKVLEFVSPWLHS